jgi:hypothetical protein
MPKSVNDIMAYIYKSYAVLTSINLFLPNIAMCSRGVNTY